MLVHPFPVAAHKGRSVVYSTRVIVLKIIISLKYAHSQNYTYPPSLNEVVQRVLSCSTNKYVVRAVRLVKKQQKSSTVQEERLTNEGRHHLLLLNKARAHDQSSSAESPYVSG